MSKIEPSKGETSATSSQQTPLTKGAQRETPIQTPQQPVQAPVETKTQPKAVPTASNPTEKGAQTQSDDDTQISAWFKQNYALAGQELPKIEDRIILTPTQQAKVEAFLKDEARRRNEPYVSPFIQPEAPKSALADTLDIPNLDPNGLTAWLVIQYNNETDPSIKQILYDKIQVALKDEPTTEPVSEPPKPTETTEEEKRVNVFKPPTIKEPEDVLPKPEILPIEQQVNDDLKPFVKALEDETKNTQAELQQKRDQKKYAMLSQIAYDSFLTSPEEANAKLQQYMPAHSILLDDTTDNYTVIQKINNQGQREITIAYRGTVLSNPSDLLADTQIFSGGVIGDPSGRYKEAEDAYLKIKKKYPDAIITLTGHSLGSSLALSVGAKHNVPTQVFNVGSSPLEFLFADNPEKKDFIKIYNVPTDFISVSNRYMTKQDVVDVPNRGNIINPLSSHALDNFLPERVVSGKAKNKPVSQPTTTPVVNQEPIFYTPIQEPIVNIINFKDSIYQLGDLIEDNTVPKIKSTEKFMYQRIPEPTNVILPNKSISSLELLDIFQSVDIDRTCKIDPITLKKTCPHKKHSTDLLSS